MGREAAREWLAVADIDIKAARNCRLGPEPTGAAAAYHCQQAAEKPIKAILVAEGVDPPRSHNLAGLVDRLPSGHGLRPVLSALESLTVYGVAYRYPAGDALARPPEPSSERVSVWIEL